MNEIIEIKRKEFEVIAALGERSYKATRKGKTYFIKDFSNDKASFFKYIDSEHDLSSTGIRSIDIYTYDKNTLLVASAFIEGRTVLDILLEEDLEDEIFEEIFKANWYMKNTKKALSFEPHNWIYNDGKLYYIGPILGKFDAKHSFEKKGIFLWFYTKEFITYLNSLSIRPDASRLSNDIPALNKKIALTVVKYYR